MKIIFNDKTELTISDGSTFSSISIAPKKFSEIDAIAKKFTVENLKHVEIDGQDYNNLIPVSMSVSGGINGADISVTVVMREQTEGEIISTQIAELQDAIAELAGEVA